VNRGASLPKAQTNGVNGLLSLLGMTENLDFTLHEIFS
jgi:hypothetical protein